MARQSAPAIPVLVTRPKAEGESFAAALTARFGGRVRPVISPLIAPRFLSPSIPGHDHAGVVFTSAQAVHAARQLGVPLPTLAWCVGRKTAAVAEAAGFLPRSADGDVESLASAILADPPDGRLLYLRGVDTHGNLLEKLISSGIATDVAIVYTQEPQPLTAEAFSLLGSPLDLIVPLFSPRTASLFLQAFPPGSAVRLHLAVMSASVAAAVQDFPRKAIAPQPDATGMLDAVETLLATLPAP